MPASPAVHRQDLAGDVVGVQRQQTTAWANSSKPPSRRIGIESVMRSTRCASVQSAGNGKVPGWTVLKRTAGAQSTAKVAISACNAALATVYQT